MRKGVTFEQALQLQFRAWNWAWAELNEDILGLDVLPFMPIHYVRLAAALSPFVCGGRQSNREDCENFLWCVSPLFDPESKWKKFRHWLRYFRMLRNVTTVELISGIYEYLDEAWWDSPPNEGKNGKAYSSTIVSYMQILCAAYSMSPMELKRTPYKALFQLAKPELRKFKVPVTAPADSVPRQPRHD